MIEKIQNCNNWLIICEIVVNMLIIKQCLRCIAGLWLMWQWLLECIKDSHKVDEDTANPSSKQSVYFVYSQQLCVLQKSF